jgi:hypothetical protein
MTTQFIIIPKHIDQQLELELNEPAYIIRERPNPTKIVFIRGNKIGREIIHTSKVETHEQKNQTLFAYKYGIVKAPQKLIPPQKKCEKTFIIEKEGEDFLIILR